MRIRNTAVLTLSTILLTALIAGAAGKEIPKQLPAADNKAPDTSKPVKVYLMMGQSNMVGMGELNGGGTRWGSEFIDPVVSVYEGKYDPKADYDKLTPIKTQKLEQFGGVKPTPFPGGGTQVVRGTLKMKTTGVYEFRPGYGGSTDNIMEIGGKEVYRKEPGQDATHTLMKIEAGKEYPFKITYLTASANGLGWTARTDIPGTLTTLVKQQGKFPWLLGDKGKWAVRNDVIYKGVISSVGQGPLTPGVEGKTIGPEIGFGWVMGYFHDEPVLLIKSSIGNRGLVWDFAPPGSKRFTYDGKVYAGYKDSPASWPEGTEPKPINWYAGKQYDDCVKATHEVLDNFDKLFPQFKSQGYKIAGFVWWQGEKDSHVDAWAAHYEETLVRFIKSIRTEFKAPEMPVVVATIGFGGKDMQDSYKRIWQAQMNVGNREKYPQYAGNLAVVDTRPFWRSVEQSPRSQGYHYNRNAGTYVQVGEAIGRAMAKLEESK